ncbi:MAG: type I methionyl aminopeptidase [Firmicutes bacterium]|nr:type I methionyl aminopeptidase [Bacillota bacterium]
MKIVVKNEKEIEKIRKAGAILTEAHNLIQKAIRVGVTTLELDAIAEKFLTESGAGLSCKGYKGFPSTICASTDDIVVHGIPSAVPLVEGQIIGIDFCCSFEGYHADMARTYGIGKVGRNRLRLIEAVQKAFESALTVVKPGNRVGDISAQIEAVAKEYGFSPVRAMVGHGIGRKMHEDPMIPNFGEAGKGPLLAAGNVLAIEPMFNAGEYDIKIDSDGWTCRTKDGSDSAHYENTVLVTESGYELLTGK